jgi:hypothetical protein
MEVRPFRPADEPAVVRLWTECGLVRSWNDPHKDILRKLGYAPDQTIVLGKHRHNDHADAIDITTCSLDEPERFAPTHHSWLSHDVRWVKFGDGLPGFQESRPKESEG